MSTAARA